ncbi:hypothetical protein ABIE58_000061 [Roseovarius sp. MBR-78]|uniref:hypothetical protein n=1 Tax=Roseovarius sp. MBR-78 TaxID=3156460 RepID=UPI0033982701
MTWVFSGGMNHRGFMAGSAADRAMFDSVERGIVEQNARIDMCRPGDPLAGPFTIKISANGR